MFEDVRDSIREIYEMMEVLEKEVDLIESRYDEVMSELLARRSG